MAIPRFLLRKKTKHRHSIRRGLVFLMVLFAIGLFLIGNFCSGWFTVIPEIFGNWPEEGLEKSNLFRFLLPEGGILLIFLDQRTYQVQVLRTLNRS